MRIEGMDRARGALQACKDLSERQVLLRRLEPLFDDAVLAIQGAAVQKAPVREGTLRGSAVSRTEFGGQTLVGQIQFGGLASAYALDQHESEEYVHPKGGQAHFLFGAPDSAWEEAQDGVLVRLDRDVERVANEVIGEAL